MADTMRWRYGDTKPVVAAVDADTAIEIGDLLFHDTDDAKPSGYDSDADGEGELWNTNLATTQEAFHDAFLGVAMQRSRVGDSDPIRVATAGVFEFASPSATYELGALVGPDKTSGNNLENQQVEAVATANLAVGRVARRAASAVKVLVEIESTVLRGGPQTPA